MTDEAKAALLGMVLELCKNNGMTAAQVCEVFNRRNIFAGFKILETRHD